MKNKFENISYDINLKPHIESVFNAVEVENICESIVTVSKLINGFVKLDV